MKILFITSTRIGDVILSTGLLEYLRKTNTDVEFTIACGPAAAPLFEEFPGLKRLLILDKMIFSLHWLRLWGYTIANFWDIIIDLRNAPISYALLRKRRYGIPRKFVNDLRVKKISETLKLSEIASPKIHPSAKAVKLSNQIIPFNCQVLAVGPTANWRAKTWESNYFAELISRLTASSGILPNAYVLLLGREDERPSALNLIDLIPENKLIDLVGGVDLLTAYACLTKSSFYIGNDSGLMHLAAASGIPTLGLFGPTREELYAPWGENTATVRTSIPYQEIFPKKFDHRTSGSLMNSLSVDKVEQAAINLWNQSKRD